MTFSSTVANGRGTVLTIPAAQVAFYINMLDIYRSPCRVKCPNRHVKSYSNYHVMCVCKCKGCSVAAVSGQQLAAGPGKCHHDDSPLHYYRQHRSSVPRGHKAQPFTTLSGHHAI